MSQDEIHSLRQDIRSLTDDTTHIKVTLARIDESLNGPGGSMKRLEQHEACITELHRFKYYLMGIAAVIGVASEWVVKLLGLNIHDKH